MIIVIVRWKRVVGDRQKNKDEIEEIKGRSGGGRKNGSNKISR